MTQTFCTRFLKGMGLTALFMMAECALAQNQIPGSPVPASGAPMSVPDGYSIHEAIDMGGRIANPNGSAAMYSTLVNLHSGPTVQGEAFELRALPGKKDALVDYLKAFSSGFGGDPNNFAKMDFSKGKLYDFSGTFRRDRQYFDYDLLANPNITTGTSVPIGPSSAPAGSFAWPQVGQSPVLFNTVRRMTDTNLTLLPLSKLKYRAGYSQNVFEGPSLSPSGYQFAGSYSFLLQQYQRNSADSFMGAVDWEPVQGTRLTFEEQVDHEKGDSYFTLAPRDFMVQEADGTKAALLISYDSQTPYGISACNTASMGSAYTSSSNYTILSPSQTPGGLPVINAACAVATGYQRFQPTRILYPTEIFRFQSSSVRNVTMNGDVRYTNANMSLPNYYDSFQGLTKASTSAPAASRSITYVGNANARREVTAADYGIIWQATKGVEIAEQASFSNAHQPGTAVMTSGTTLSTATAPNQTINYPTLNTINAASGASTFEGSPSIATPLPGYFGQKFVTNNLTASWDVTPRATLSLGYRYRLHTIAEGSGNPGDIPIPAGETTGGTVTIHENGGMLNAAFRPARNWSLNGTVEMFFHDNVFTPVGPRQTQHYKLRTTFKPKPWAVISAAYNDVERHNNTNNAQQDVAAGSSLYYGPIDHVDHSRVASLSADLSPNEHYGLSFSYAYSDVFTATNICYTSASSATLPGAATAPGTSLPPNVYPNGVCQGVFGHGGSALVDWFGRDFMDAPTQNGSVALALSPVTKLHSNIGYHISSVAGNQFFTDARAVNGSLDSTYQAPFANVAWTIHKGLIWKGEYDYYGYGEGGPSGAPYCSFSTSATATVVPCSSVTGYPTGMTEPSSGLTAPRNFHANNATLGFHYEF